MEAPHKTEDQEPTIHEGQILRIPEDMDGLPSLPPKANLITGSRLQVVGVSEEGSLVDLEYITAKVLEMRGISDMDEATIIKPEIEAFSATKELVLEILRRATEETIVMN